MARPRKSCLSCAMDQKNWAQFSVETSIAHMRMVQMGCVPPCMGLSVSCRGWVRFAQAPPHPHTFNPQSSCKTAVILSSGLVKNDKLKKKAPIELLGFHCIMARSIIPPPVTRAAGDAGSASAASGAGCLHQRLYQRGRQRHTDE